VISEKNFHDMDPALIPVDTEYERCNFSRSQPDMSGPIVGVRLFPGDDTPRTFTDCNLFNCEPPPGSTLIRCNTWIAQTGQLAHTDELIVDTVVLDTTQYHKQIRHGRYNPLTESYDYDGAPIESGEDY